MAKGSSDVQLTIRARNEASKAIDSVASALAGLKATQADVTQESRKTGSTLEQLGAAMEGLTKSAGGLTAYDRVVTNLQRTSQEVASVEAAIAGLTSRQAELIREVQQTEAALTGLNTSAQKLETALAQQQAASKAATGEQNRLEAAVKKTSSSYDKANNDVARYAKQLATAETRLERSGIRHRELTQELLRVDEPTSRLIERFEKADATLRKNERAVETLRQSYAASRETVAQLSAILPRLKGGYDAAAVASQKAVAAQAETSNQLKATQAEITSTSAALSKLQRASATAASQLEKQGTALEKAEADLKAMQAAADEAGVAMERVGTSIRGRLLRELAASRKSLADYRAEWERTTAVVREMAASGASAKDPTPEMSKAISEARAAKQAYEQTQAAVHTMRQALREAGTDVAALTRAQQTFVRSLGQIRASADSATTAVERNAKGMNDTASAAKRLDQNTRNSANAMELFQAKTRMSMSITQRLRGEVLALATAYFGLFGAIQQLQGVTRTFMDIEAAQTRMGVAFDGNGAVVAREMRFVREEANRLKIDFRMLAGEYSKFAIATKGTSIAGEETRRIFITLAEAFRVSKLSADQMQGAFLAVTQMVNKGAVSMEELRQQLGERLYGAFRLAGDAMGLTGKELDKLVSSGQLATDVFLPKFAEQVEKTFGPQLGDSLATFTAELGDFQNAVVETQERFANAGFMEGLTNALKRLTEYLRSDEGVTFFENLGAAAGIAVEVLAEIPAYLDQIVFVMSLLIGMRVAGWLTTLSKRFREALATMKPLPATVANTNKSLTALNNTAKASAPLMTRLRTSVAGMGASFATAAKGMTAARAGSVAVSGAMNGLRAATAFLGGIPGVLVTIASVGLSLWLGRTRDATDAMADHERQLDAVLDRYTVATDKTGDWAESIKGVTLAGAEKTLTDLASSLAKDIEAAGDGLAGAIESSLAIGGDINLTDIERQFLELVNSARAGRTSVADLSKALDGILKSSAAPERLKNLIRQNSGLVTAAARTEQALVDQGVIVRQLGGDIGDLEDKYSSLGMTMDEVAARRGFGADAGPGEAVSDWEKLEASIEALKEKVPSLTDEMKLMEGLKEIDDILDTAGAIEGLDKTGEAFQRLINLANQAKTELRLAFDEKQFKGLTSVVGRASGTIESSAALLRTFEGFRATPYWDVNAHRVGYGSDTITLSDGTIKRVTEGMRVSMADANRDLLRRIEEFQDVIRGQVGSDRFDRLSDQQQAALTSVAYNYGSLPKSVVAAVKEGSAAGVAEAIRGLGGHNEGVNRDRRNQEAFLFASGEDAYASANRSEETLREQLKEEEKLAQAAKRRVEQQENFHNRLNESLELKRMEAESDKKMTQEQAVQLEIAKQQSAARLLGTELTEDQLATIREVTEAEWLRQNATREQEEAEKRINTLMQTRRDLLQQMEMALNQGDMQAYSLLDEQLTSLDEKLKTLIQEAIQLWQALGGGEQVDAAVANLQVMLGTLNAVRHQVRLLASDFGEAFGEQLTSAADNFLSKIRETGDVVGSAKEAFRQFASDFLLQIAKMIMQQAIFNALSGVFGGSAGGSFGAGVMSVFKAHTGGVVGQGLQPANFSAGVFANALRYHTGGIAGLAPNEVPAVLLKGEEVLTEDDPRHIRNGGGAAPEQSVKIVNAIDAGSFMSAGVEDVQGQKAILNFIQANRATVRNALGV